MARAVAASVVLLSFLGLCLFLAAGTAAWPMAWYFLLVFAAFIAATFALVDPDLVRERASPGKEAQRSDVILASLGFLGLYPGVLLTAGLDAVRYGWTPPLPAALRFAALGVFILGYAFALWAMRSNRFFATFVRIQTERGHRVIEAGPYVWVRHPGYAGTLVAHLALPLALGSLVALVPAAVGSAVFVLRTVVEDRTLGRELPGYAAYQRRVPWRLVPGLW
jgi:protein-S-isoprenylcysteine O-methyltransferase Ste14